MDLRRILEEVMASETDHARRLVKCAAVISESLRGEGLEATVVGGSAIEIHAPGAYTTSDLDLIVPERYGVDWSTAQERAFRSLGFERRGRHWVRDDLFVEIPSRALSDPVVTLHVGPFDLRVVAKEVVLADRIVGFKHWGMTDYGLQAIAMVTAFGAELDQAALQGYLERENARDAYELLQRLTEEGGRITHEVLQVALDHLWKSGGAK